MRHSRPTSRRPVARLITMTAFASVVGAASAAAHDFWIIPDMFIVAADAIVHVNGRQGGDKFPAGTAVQPERVVDARIIGAASSTKITAMSVDGTSLRLQQKPTVAGQYLIVVGLASRVSRSTPAGVIRFLKAEGGAAEAGRLERENSLAGLDSVIYAAASYAATLAQVGVGGARAFGKAAGLRLEFVALNDPAHVHVGDTLHVRVLGNGAPLPNIGVDLAAGVDSTATASVIRIALNADAQGIVHLPLSSAGPMMLRSAYASHKVGGAPTEWDVSRTTYVFNVGAKH